MVVVCYNTFLNVKYFLKPKIKQMLVDKCPKSILFEPLSSDNKFHV